MTTCKRLEESAIDYVCDLLDDEQVSVIKEHLRYCPDCVGEIASWQNVLIWTEKAGAIPIPDAVLNQIEMKVYKRLAAESPLSKQSHLFSRLVSPFVFLSARLGGMQFIPMKSGRRLSLSHQGSAWVWRSAVATCTLAIGITVGTLFLNREQPSAPVQSSVERLEQYQQQEIQRRLKDALEARHLKGDDSAATSQFRLLKEQTQGTPWAKIANNQLQITSSVPKEGI
jgi:hypothetical protein